MSSESRIVGGSDASETAQPRRNGLDSLGRTPPPRSARAAFVPNPGWPSIVELAKERWGEPNERMSKPDDIRFGAKGSKSVIPSANTWFDNEADDGGGYVDMHHATRGELPKKDKQSRHNSDNLPPWQDIASIYDYRDADGTLILQVIRTASGNPPFRQRRPNGKDRWLWSTKDIPPAARPLYRLPGLRASGTETVWICEGEKDADTLHDKGLIATTNVGGAGKWQNAYAAEFHGKPCVVLQDNDQAGRNHTGLVARSIAGVAASVKVLLLPNLPPKGDVSDWLDAGGTLAELERLARETPEYSKQEPEPTPGAPERGQRYGRLIVLGMDDLDTSPLRSYLLKGLISPGEISIWVGAPKCGKSFLLLHVSYMLSLARSVFGRRVKQATVLYVAAEGEGGIAGRIRALRARYGPSPAFHFIAQPADLLHHDGDLDHLVEAASAIGATLIVLDTLSRLMAGGDENSPVDMGTFVKNVSSLRERTKAHVGIVHHGTKASNGTSPRGHSSLTGADDALIEVAKLEDGSRVATVVHAKDDADGDRFGFTLERVELGTDDDDDPITTLIVNEASEPPPAQRARLSDNLQIGMKTLHAALKASDVILNTGSDEPERKAVAEADWRTWFYREGKPGENQETKQKAFRRIVDGLQAKGLIGSRDGFVWPEGRS